MNRQQHRSQSPGFRRNNNERFSNRKNDYRRPPINTFPEQENYDAEKRRRNNEPMYTTANNTNMDMVIEDGRIDFSDCYLRPPHDTWTPRRLKPVGCRTIFVGGFPDKIMAESNRLMDIVREVFTLNGGQIESVRKNNKGFFHVRFVMEESVDAAIKVLGYFMVIRNICGQSEVSFRLRVDFSETRGDLHDMRSTEMLAKSLNVPGSSIPNMPSFSDAAVQGVIDSFKEPDKFQESVIVVRGWINSNLITKDNSTRVFMMLQASYLQVQNLLEQKKQLNEEYKTVQTRYRSNIIRLRKGFNNLILLYEDAHKQSAWDKFTRPQRKSIDTWLNQAKDGLSANRKLEMPGEEGDKLMELCDENYGEGNSKQNNSSSVKNSLQEVQQQVWDLIVKLQTKDNHIKEKNEKIENLKKKIDGKRDLLTKKQEENHLVPKKDAKLLCALASFLRVFPDGAFVRHIKEYLIENKIDASIETVEVLFLKLPDLFELNVSLVDGKPCHKWSCKNK